MNEPAEAYSSEPSGVLREFVRRLSDDELHTVFEVLVLVAEYDDSRGQLESLIRDEFRKRRDASELH